MTGDGRAQQETDMTDVPHRVQLSRRKGWRMPENTVSVARPTKWGNPFKVGERYLEESGLFDASTPAKAVTLYRDWLLHKMSDGPSLHSMFIRSELRKLRGRNLACWCPLDQPCHADVLLELANGD